MFGFLQLNATLILVADFDNHCLRFIDWQTEVTWVAIGKCQSMGYVDGGDGVATFNRPFSLIWYKDMVSFLVADYGNDAVRLVNIGDTETFQVSTLVSTGLSGLAGLSYIVSEDILFVSNSHYLLRVKGQEESILAGSIDYGFAEGSLADAALSAPREIIHVTDDVIVAADQGNGRLAVVNSRMDYLLSVCLYGEDERNGYPTTCQLYEPVSLFLKDEQLFIGTGYGIKRIAGRRKLHSTPINNYTLGNTNRKF